MLVNFKYKKNEGFKFTIKCSKGIVSLFISAFMSLVM